MFWLNILPFDLNKFWEKTPTILKYLLLSSIIFVAAYILFSRTGTTIEINRLRNIQQSVDNIYVIVENFETFQTYQMEFNKSTLQDIQNLHKIIIELNYITGRKFGYIINETNETDQQLKQKMELLDSYLIKLIDAYSISNQYPDPPIFNTTKK